MKRTIILSVFTLLVFGSCQRNSTVELRLNHAEELMSEHPDSAWHILESIDRKALDSRRIRARHALLSSQALDKNYIDVNNDSLIRIAIDYYAKHGSYEDRAKAYYYHAIVQRFKYRGSHQSSRYSRGICQENERHSLERFNIFVSRGPVL